MDHRGWPFFMVRLDGPTSMVRFLKNSIYKAFGPLTRCRPNVDQEESSCTKSECDDFLNICPKMTILKIIQVWPVFGLVFIFSPPPKKIKIKKIKNIKNCYNGISLSWALAFVRHSTFFASSIAKPVEPCHTRRILVHSNHGINDSLYLTTTTPTQFTCCDMSNMAVIFKSYKWLNNEL